MGYLELDSNLSSEAKAMAETARKFGMEVMRPAGIELDKLADPQDVIAKDSVLWDVQRQYRELGFHRAAFSKEVGGMREDMDAGSGSLVSEAFGYADPGLAISLGVSAFPFMLASMTQDPELMGWVKDFCNDDKAEMIGCWAITEPDRGSDWILAALPHACDPKLAPTVRAELKGDEYILNGRKAAWVSNGTIATHAALHVCLDPDKGMHGSGLAVIDLDRPGISRAKPLDKMGQRALNQGEIIFEDAKIPKKLMVIPNPELMQAIAKMILTTANTGMGMLFVGLAQAAFDEALSYAKERIQGGVPIIEHQNIKLKLFRMFSQVEAARSLSRRVSAYNMANQPAGSSMHAMASKIFSTETAFEVASEAIQILGGNGLSKEYLVEKIFRDARASMIEDGVNEVLALGAAEEL